MSEGGMVERGLYTPSDRMASTISRSLLNTPQHMRIHALFKHSKYNQYSQSQQDLRK